MLLRCQHTQTPNHHQDVQYVCMKCASAGLRKRATEHHQEGCEPMARIRSSLRYDESQTPPVQNCNLVLAILQRNHLRPVVTLFSSGFLWGLQYSLTVGLLFWSSKTRLALLRVSLPCGLPDDPTTRKNYDEDTHCASIIANSLRCMVAASRYVSTDRGQTPGCPCASHFTLGVSASPFESLNVSAPRYGVSFGAAPRLRNVSCVGVSMRSLFSN